MPGWQAARSAILLAGAFFALGALVSGDIGPTADEHETLWAGERNLEIVAGVFAGEPTPDWSFHELEGYYFVADTVRALWGHALGALGVADPLHAQHLAHLLFASLTLWLLFAIVRACGGPPRAALLAALALATLPQFVAHSQNNPKDLPAAFTFALALYAVIATGLQPGKGRALLAGAALGLALTTRVHAVFAPLIGWGWLALRADRLPAGAFTRQAIVAAGGLGFGLAFWPHLWPDPLGLVLEATHGLTAKVFTIPVLYLGQIYPAHEVPWHYRPVLLLATTPLSLLLLSVIGCRHAAGDAASPGRQAAARLGVLWLTVLLLADGLAWSRYDGVRHFLLALPALALLAGLGADGAIDWLRARTASRALALLPLLPFAIGALAVATLHPYPGAALGAPARLLADGPSDQSFELEYWGQSYLEGARWLEANAEPDSEIVVPLFAELAQHSLSLPVRAGLVEDWEPTDRPRYLMMIARRAYYDAPLAALEAEREPVFEVRRTGGRLLAIYRNDAAASSEGETGRDR